MHDNKLLLNEAKTEFLLIGTKQQLAKGNIPHVKVGNVNIAPGILLLKILRVWFDSNLSMVDHITKTRSAAFYHLYSIRRIRRYLTKECTETLIHAFISSRLDYCNSLSFESEFLNAIFINYRVQNAAARLARGGGYYPKIPIRVCAAQRGRDFGTPYLERGIHFRDVS